MGRRFEYRLNAVKLILKTLEGSPTRSTPLLQKAMSLYTPWVTVTCLKWLLAEGYVERPRRGLYALTEKGGQLLGALSQASESPRLT